MVRVGFPGWKLFARLGLPVHVRVTVHFDEQSKTFWADSADLDGLIVSGNTPEELATELREAAASLIGLAMSGSTRHGAIVVKQSLADTAHCHA